MRNVREIVFFFQRKPQPTIATNTRPEAATNESATIWVQDRMLGIRVITCTTHTGNLMGRTKQMVLKRLFKTYYAARWKVLKFQIEVSGRRTLLGTSRIV